MSLEQDSARKEEEKESRKLTRAEEELRAQKQTGRSEGEEGGLLGSKVSSR